MKDSNLSQVCKKNSSKHHLFLG